MSAILWLLAAGWLAAAGWNAAAREWETAAVFGAAGVLTLFALWVIDKITEPSSGGQAGQPGRHMTRPQAGLSKYSSEYDHEVWRALETEEQRKSGRNRGGDITVTVSKGRGWDTWRAGAEIWEDQQIGASDGVYVQFEDPGDTPTHNDFGALVPKDRSDDGGYWR